MGQVVGDVVSRRRPFWFVIALLRWGPEFPRV